MSKIIKRPKLNSKASYALQCKNSGGFIANTMPMTITASEARRETFTGSYLNQTAFDWQYTLSAIEVAQAAKPKTRRAAPAKPKRNKPSQKKGKK